MSGRRRSSIMDRIFTSKGKELWESCEEGNAQEAYTWIQKGANLDYKNSEEDNKTALHEVARLGYFPLVQLLLENNCAVNIFDDQGNTPLHLACSGNGDIRCIEEIVHYNGKDGQGGIDLEAKNQDGVTALHIAAYMGFVDDARFLIERGSDGNTDTGIDRYQKTPLHAAAFLGHDDVIQLLLDNNVSVYKRDDNGRLAIDLANENHHTKCIELLTNYMNEHERNENERKEESLYEESLKVKNEEIENEIIKQNKIKRIKVIEKEILKHQMAIETLQKELNQLQN